MIELAHTLNNPKVGGLLIVASLVFMFWRNERHARRVMAADLQDGQDCWSGQVRALRRVSRSERVGCLSAPTAPHSTECAPPVHVADGVDR